VFVQMRERVIAAKACVEPGPPCRPAPVLACPQGFVSSASYAAKRTQMVLFINGRAVECGPMRRALEATYAQLLPKVGGRAGGRATALSSCLKCVDASGDAQRCADAAEMRGCMR